MTGTYKEIAKQVNESYAKTKDIRDTMRETGVSFGEVWEMVGLKDYFDFEETDEDGMEGLIFILILGWCIWMLIRHPLKSLGLIFKVGILLLLGTGGILAMLGGVLYLTKV